MELIIRKYFATEQKPCIFLKNLSAWRRGNTLGQILHIENILTMLVTQLMQTSDKLLFCLLLRMNRKC